MRAITLNKRQARILREQLTGDLAGYDTLDLWRIDHLAKKLTSLQGEYAEKLAELVREDKRIRRANLRGQIETIQAERELLALQYDVEDLDGEAEHEIITFEVEDGDYKLILDRLDSQNRWTARDAIRTAVIGMLEAVKNAEKVGEEEAPSKKVKPIRG